MRAPAPASCLPLDSSAARTATAAMRITAPIRKIRKEAISARKEGAGGLPRIIIAFSQRPSLSRFVAVSLSRRRLARLFVHLVGHRGDFANPDIAKLDRIAVVLQLQRGFLRMWFVSGRLIIRRAAQNLDVILHEHTV